jgi:hypothetical protein
MRLPPTFMLPVTDYGTGIFPVVDMRWTIQ